MDQLASRRKDDPKRQRTNSDSSEDPTKENQLNNSGDEAESRKKSIEVSRNIRSGPARNHRTKDFREQEEQREKARADAAGRRKGRAERRRGDGEPPRSVFKGFLLIYSPIPTLQKSRYLALPLQKARINPSTMHLK